MGPHLALLPNTVDDAVHQRVAAVHERVCNLVSAFEAADIFELRLAGRSTLAQSRCDQILRLQSLTPGLELPPALQRSNCDPHKFRMVGIHLTEELVVFRVLPLGLAFRAQWQLRSQVITTMEVHRSCLQPSIICVPRVVHVAFEDWLPTGK